MPRYGPPFRSFAAPAKPRNGRIHALPDKAVYGTVATTDEVIGNTVTFQMLTKRLATLLLLTLWPWQAAACMNSNWIQHTLFLELPVALETQPVVARVKILRVAEPERAELSEPDVATEYLMKAAVTLSSAIVYVEVLDGIRGVADGEVLSVSLPLHSCSVALDRTEIGTESYIAGQIINGLFSGSWSQLAIEGLE